MGLFGQKFILHPLSQGYTTQVSGRAKNFFECSKGQILQVFTDTKGVFIKNKLNKQRFGLRGPHLARGPFVVHACSKPNFWLRHCS
jgi:hypothetical protein